VAVELLRCSDVQVRATTSGSAEAKSRSRFHVILIRAPYRSATRLAAPLGGTREFGGYVVPRSSLGRVDGALLRRVISLIGGGAKGMSYFML
jgi:hypothetical protein